jgi:hypothetical protein
LWNPQWRFNQSVANITEQVCIDGESTKMPAKIDAEHASTQKTKYIELIPDHLGGTLQEYRHPYVLSLG